MKMESEHGVQEDCYKGFTNNWGVVAREMQSQTSGYPFAWAAPQV